MDTWVRVKIGNYVRRTKYTGERGVQIASGRMKYGGSGGTKANTVYVVRKHKEE